MLENFFKRFKQDNGVSAEIENTPYVNVEGLEGKINVPEPTKEDKKWANKVKNATSEAVTSALKLAIEEGKNWRVWFLLNRPFKEAKEFLGGFVNFREKGFGGNVAVEAGLQHAAKHNNVTAAYLLLKFAEKNQTTLVAGNGDHVREELTHYTATALQDAADKPGSDVYSLLAKTFSSLHDKMVHPTVTFSIQDYQPVMKESAVRAAAEGHFGHLDAMLDNRLLTPPQFVEAYMTSFLLDQRLWKDDTAVEGRKQLLDWMLQKGIIDQTFADEARMVETRMIDAQRTAAEATAIGWRQSMRDLPLSDGSIQKHDAAQAEITRKDERDGGAVTFVFNYNSMKAHRIKGALVQEVPEAQVDQSLAAEGRNFLESLHTEAPSLEWKKGEPFRLRFKPQPLPQP